MNECITKNWLEYIQDVELVHVRAVHSPCKQRQTTVLVKGK